MKSLIVILSLIAILPACASDNAHSGATQSSATRQDEPVLLDFAFDLRRDGYLVSQPRIVTPAGEPMLLETETDGMKTALAVTASVSHDVVHLRGTVSDDHSERAISQALTVGEPAVLAVLTDGTELSVTAVITPN